MNHSAHRSPIGAILLILGALTGLGLALYAYLMPLTGVTGTIGAGLVVFSTAIMLVAAILTFFLSPGFFSSLISGLIILDVICTFAAGYFLHEWWLMAAMVVACIGAVWQVASRPSGHIRSSDDTQGVTA